MADNAGTGREDRALEAEVAATDEDRVKVSLSGGGTQPEGDAEKRRGAGLPSPALTDEQSGWLDFPSGDWSDFCAARERFRARGRAPVGARTHGPGRGVGFFRLRTAALLVAALGLASVAAGAPATRATLTKLCSLPTVPAQIVRFQAGDGAKLVGAVAGSGPTGVVLASQADGSMCDWISSEDQTLRALVASGYRVLLFDYRGLGHSPRASGAPKARERDVVAAATELERLGARRVALVGASVGGVLAIAAADQLRPRPVAVVGWSATGANGPNTGPDFGNVDGTAAAAKLRTPLLLVAAKGDADATSQAQTLYRAAPSSERHLLVVPGGSHGFFDLDPVGARVRARTLAFIGAHSHGR